MQTETISLDFFKKARQKITHWIHHTPLPFSRPMSDIISSQRGKKTRIYFKMENKQITGSFKVRGALSKILSLSAQERGRTLISYSAGNHAQGVAYSARCVKTSALVVLPVSIPSVKEEAVRSYGTQILKKRRFYDEGYHLAMEICQQKNGIFIHPYNDPWVIAGQGSVGLEILEQLPDVDSVIIPIGGGGLMGGVAGVIKQMKPACRVYGVVCRSAPAMECLFHHKPYSADKDFISPTLADGISVKEASSEMFEKYLSPYMDDVMSVTEEEIALAIVLLLGQCKTLVEGAGAVGVAMLLKPSHWDLGEKSVVLLSGGNIDLPAIPPIIKRGLKLMPKYLK